ncbi:MAG: hypothetical protein L6R39_000050 [Caloplaca ligustica]|nr:MAG: hypothetical protein L6R39_000050 [Caloplaca ligustica]
MKFGSLFTHLLYTAAAVVEAAPQYDASETAASRQITKWQRQYIDYIENTIKTRKAGCTKDKIIYRQEWQVTPIGLPSTGAGVDSFLGRIALPSPRPFLCLSNNSDSHMNFQGLFYPFHRYYVHLYEKALRDECGYKGTQPYWDWTLGWQDPAKSAIFDGSRTSMGGNGKFIPNNTATNLTAFGINLIIPPASGGGCVQQGPFKEGTFTVNLGPATFNPNTHGNGLGYNPRCLKRDISTIWAANTRPTYVQYQLANKTCGDDFECFGIVSEALNGTHTGGHYTWGGDPGFDPYSAAGDPIFFLHHAQVDRLWTMWQALNPEVRARQVYGTETAFNSPPSANVTFATEMDYGVLSPKQAVGDVLSSIDGPFCYAYL